VPIATQLSRSARIITFPFASTTGHGVAAIAPELFRDRSEVT